MMLLFLSFSMTSWAQIDPSAMADVSLTVTSNKSEIFIGENVTYTIKVQNDAHTSVTGLQVKLLDILPPGSSYVSKTAAAGTSYAQATGIWTIGSALTASNRQSDHDPDGESRFRWHSVCSCRGICNERGRL